MACEKCRQAGQETKVFRYAAEDGRWRKIETCKHRTRRVWLETSIVRKSSGQPRRTYTLEQDRFILTYYKAGHDHKQHGMCAMQKMAERFSELFKIPTTANMLIGRYHRLAGEDAPIVEGEGVPLIELVRAVPSLAPLKFTQNAGSDHA
jgi:hypothetical protein